MPDGLPTSMEAGECNTAGSFFPWAEAAGVRPNLLQYAHRLRAKPGWAGGRGAFWENAHGSRRLCCCARRRGKQGSEVMSAARQLEGLGVRFSQGPHEAGGVTTAVLDDTCGNLIQIISCRTRSQRLPEGSVQLAS